MYLSDLGIQDKRLGKVHTFRQMQISPRGNLTLTEFQDFSWGEITSIIAQDIWLCHWVLPFGFAMLHFDL